MRTTRIALHEAFMALLAFCIALSLSPASVHAQAQVSVPWWPNLTSSSCVVEQLTHPGSVRLGNCTSGFGEGTVTLPWNGNWDLEFIVETDEATAPPRDPSDPLKVFINGGLITTLVNDPPNDHPVVNTTVVGSSFTFRFEFASGNATLGLHMLAFAGTATTVGDHFTCYRSGASKGSLKFPGVPNPPGTTLVDQFGSSTVAVKKPTVFCAPTNKNAEDPTAPLHPEHLRAYQVKPAAKPVLPGNVLVTNQFGSLRVDVKKPSRLLVPTAKSLVPPPPASPAPLTDHFQCYQVKITKGTDKFVPVANVTVQDQFGTMIVTVKKPTALCAPVNKNNEAPGADTHPGHLMCYQIKQTSTPKFARVSGALISNQLGQETIDVKAPAEICVPSLKTLPGIATPTATATPAPTATPTPPCTPHSSGTYTDNCDGTVTDSATGLMWEQKTTAVGSGEHLADPHDVDNRYSWSTSGSTVANGTVFTDFLVKLNTVPCFAGHCDWRLPSEAGRESPYTGPKELESILVAAYPCGVSPCIDPIFGPTAAWYHFSSTTFSLSPFYAWFVYFHDGYTYGYGKSTSIAVRAVRTE
jgi:hypothetical protein